MPDDMLNSTSFDKWFIWVLKTFHICNCLFSPLRLSLYAVSWLPKVESDPLSNKAFVLTLKLPFDKITGITCKQQLLLWWLLTNTGNVWHLFSCGCLLPGGSFSCSKLWWCFPHLSVLHLYFDLHCFLKCALDKQFQPSLLVEANCFLSCKVFLMNFLHSISLCGWLHKQQTFCLSVNVPSIVAALVFALYGGTFSSCLAMIFGGAFSSCLAMIFALGLKIPLNDCTTTCRILLTWRHLIQMKHL